MGEREMLELAAKSIGEQVVGESAEGLLLYGIEEAWNPLHDDGQALRLAVEIGPLEFSISEYGTAVRKPNGRWSGCEAHLHGGKQAATRRAIVLAAAEIGAQQGKGEDK